MSYGILALLAVVIAVGILNLYRVIIYERTREIGTMRAIGIQRPQVRNLILLEALLLAVCGIAGGVVVSVRDPDRRFPDPAERLRGTGHLP